MKLLKFYPGLVLGLIAFAACSKDNTEPDEGGMFKPSDFEISSIVAEQDGAVFINYDVKNVSGKDYSYDVSGQFFDIQWTVKTTDGTLYQTDRGIPEPLLKDAVATSSASINLSAGKQADLSTLEYKVFLDE